MLKDNEHRPHWTEESEERLRKLWGKGLPGSHIANLMQMTRSAIMGKVYRMKLAKRTQY